jgi:23S rRNA pseudouridine955/2504/2580 synthase
MREFKINKNDAGQRLDKFIGKAVKNLPSSLLYKSIRTKKIKVNRKRATIDQILNEGDSVLLFISDEFFTDAPSHVQLKMTPRLDIIYEDENVMLLNKRPGMLSHPDDAEPGNTLIDHITTYLYQKGEYDPEAENSFAPSLCNRIDRNTGGIVIAAKNAAALRIMNQKIKDRELTKLYLAAVHGVFEKKSATLTGYLIKDHNTNTVKIFDRKPAGKNVEIKSVITKYKVLGEKNGNSLVEVDLITGRTHQIRAHMASIGHPLVGDGKYGVNKFDREKGYKYQALYSYKLSFDFTTDAGVLSYLDQKSFEVSTENIWFYKDFSKL